MHRSFASERTYNSNGGLTPYGALTEAARDVEPRTVIQRGVIPGYICRMVNNDVWPGATLEPHTFTRYDAVESTRDTDTTMQMREGGVAPAPRQRKAVA